MDGRKWDAIFLSGEWLVIAYCQAESALPCHVALIQIVLLGPCIWEMELEGGGRVGKGNYGASTGGQVLAWTHFIYKHAALCNVAAVS